MNPRYRPDGDATPERLADLLRALAHPDRVRLVQELADREQDVSTLCDRLGVRQARVSQHLAVLRSSHVVEDRRQGRHVLYRLAKPALAAWLLIGGSLGVPAVGYEEAAEFLEETRIEAIEEEDKRRKSK